MKHWVFDLDCTLVDSSGTYEAALAHIFKHFDVPWSNDILQQALYYFDPRELFSKYLDSRQISEAEQLILKINDQQIEQIAPYPEIPDLLSELQNHKVAISVWTGRDTSSTKRILDNTGLSKYIGLCVGRSCVPRTKPYPDGLLQILSESKHHGDDVTMIGDHEYDIRGARAAGVRSVSVSWNSQGKSPLEELSDRHFYQIQDLKNWMLGHYR